MTHLSDAGDWRLSASAVGELNHFLTAFTVEANSYSGCIIEKKKGISPRADCLRGEYFSLKIIHDSNDPMCASTLGPSGIEKLFCRIRR